MFVRNGVFADAEPILSFEEFQVRGESETKGRIVFSVELMYPPGFSWTGVNHIFEIQCGSYLHFYSSLTVVGVKPLALRRQ